LSIFSSHERNIDMLWAAQTWEGGAARCRRWTRLSVWARFSRCCFVMVDVRLHFNFSDKTRVSWNVNWVNTLLYSFSSCQG